MDDRERSELKALREEVARLRAQLALGRTTHESARAALNLMEDAVSARRDAETASRAKDDFLAVASHELRTPLAAITLWSRALRSATDPRDVELAIASIEQSADFQSRLIDDILDLSRLGAGRLALSRDATNVGKLVDAAVEAVKPLAAPKRVSLASEVDPKIGVIILDKTRLTQILWNLLTNAIKFTLDGGSVCVNARLREKQLEITVEDDGEGISPHFLPHVFERFRQADMGAARRHVGLGIGLTLVKELVELHGGTIRATSEGLGHGATFHVLLPVERGEVQAEWRAPESERSLRSLRVLLVEDDASTRTAMIWTLEHAGATVWAVGSAHDALLAVDHADVLVSDIGLPGMSGIELVTSIAESCRRRGQRPLPSCAISAHTRDTDRRRAIDAGFDIFLTKPVSADHLIEAVADLRGML